MPVPPVSSLPEELTNLAHWVAWREELRPGSNKKTKVPYCLATGQHASSTKPADWSQFPDVEIPDAYAGLGFVFTKSAGFTGIDLDDCLIDGSIKPWAAEILQLLPSYSEISPSGNGIKIWTRAQLPGNGLKVYIDAEGNRTVESMSDGCIEMYDSGRYFTVTGNLYGTAINIPDLQSGVTALYTRLRGNERPDFPPSAPRTFEIPDGPAIAEGGRHSFLLNQAAKWRARGMDVTDLLNHLRDLNASRCSPPKPDFMLKGIADWFGDKAPSYRLTKRDYESAAQWAEKPSGEKEGRNRGETGEKLATNGHAPLQIPDGPQSSVAMELAPESLSEPAGPEPSSPLKFRVLQAIEKGVESCYETDLARLFALAQLSGAQAAIESDALEDKLRKTFGKELNLTRLRKSVKLIRDEIVKSSVGPDDDGMPRYILTAEGGMLANLANAMTMLRELPLQYNAFTCRPFLTEPSPWGTSGNWADYDDVKATEWCQRKSLNIEIRTAAAAADAVARGRVPHFHPVKAYLTSLHHDGEDRISTWMHEYLGVPDTAYTRGVSRKWLISAVKRVMEPGAQCDYTLVLEGTQGRRKSTALRVLAGDWFTDDIAEIGTKDSSMQLQGKWIVEIAELDAFRRAEMTTIKAWLVRREDHFRPPYGRRAEDFPRQNVFAASTNKDDWGMDDTGLRRFWPVKVGEINIHGLATVRDQLWAEAFFYYSEGETSYLSETLEVSANEQQLERQDRDIEADRIEAWCLGPIPRGSGDVIRSTRGRVYVAEVPWHCLGIEPSAKGHPQFLKSRICRILTLAGWLKTRESKSQAEEDGIQREYWVRMRDR